jgi:hypothetical protein
MDSAVHVAFGLNARNDRPAGMGCQSRPSIGNKSISPAWCSPRDLDNNQYGSAPTLDAARSARSTMTFLATVRHDRITVSAGIDAPIKEPFTSTIQRVPTRHHRYHGQARLHKTDSVRRALRAPGARLFPNTHPTSTRSSSSSPSQKSASRCGLRYDRTIEDIVRSAKCYFAKAGSPSVNRVT